MNGDLGDLACGQLCLVSLAALCTHLAYRGFRARRIVENLPTTKAAGVVFGLTELKGAAEPDGEALVSPLLGRACVFFRYAVAEWQEITDSDGTRRDWVQLEGGWKAVDFLARDESGAVAVDVRGAIFDGVKRIDEVQTAGELYERSRARHPGQGAKRRFVEETIDAGGPVYVLGEATLSEETGHPVIGKAPMEREEIGFLIDGRGERAAKRDFFLIAWGLLAAAVGLWYWDVLAFVGTLAGETPGWAHVPAFLVAAAVPPLVYATLLFNDLYWVRERMRRAFSMIDVELKKRADLVPNLVGVAKGYAKHEAAALEAFARGRYEGARDAAAAGAAMDGQTAALGRVMAVAEALPDLKASSAFLDLAARLTAIENRLGHIRDFYNESVTAYNTRIGVFPDAILAQALLLRPRPLLAAQPFERIPVAVRLARETHRVGG